MKYMFKAAHILWAFSYRSKKVEVSVPTSNKGSRVLKRKKKNSFVVRMCLCMRNRIVHVKVATPTKET